MALAPTVVEATPLRDIVVLLDSSGSIEQQGWDDEKDFVIDLLGTEFNEDFDRLGIVRYSSSGSVTKEHYFNQSQDYDDIATLIDGLIWTQGATAHRTALENAMDIIEWTGRHTPYSDNPDDWADPDTPQVPDEFGVGVLLLTDGNPYPYHEQNPCKDSFRAGNSTDRNYMLQAQALREDLQYNNVDVRVVGFGDDWNPNILSCLVDDEASDIINGVDFYAGFLDDFALPINYGATVPEPNSAWILFAGLIPMVRRWFQPSRWVSAIGKFSGKRFSPSRERLAR